MLSTVRRLSRQDTLGWIGLGAMVGHPMALNLFSKTYLAHSKQPSGTDIPSFVICEQDEGRAQTFVAALKDRGGTELAARVERVENGRSVSQKASRIFTMLPNSPQVESVYLEESTGILAGLRSLPTDAPSLTPLSPIHDDSASHTLLIDHTTLDPSVAKRIASTTHQTTSGKVVMLDAPVSGAGTVAASAGLLTIMLGSPSAYATTLAMPLLQQMAREGGIILCGENGTGIGVKVANNMILAINQIALAEGLALGRSLGIDPLLLHSVIDTSSGQSWSSRVNSPLPQVPNSPGFRNYQGGFQSKLMLKDVGLALHAAHEYDLPTPLTWAAQSVYEAVCAEGEGEMATKDFRYV
ncbi:hypothetical protein M231_00007 [Tremella mesenterica]|uniref:3-hydroxyisobutyrate dehydrogenase n=1 Tax=Tremella mesenterica TaxID=5217 RepID=A0A4Q1BWA5_TREME|nr:hypothetical protein M231_00007 [Tremella mesenterica]